MVAVLAIYALIVAVGQNGPSTVSAPETERLDVAGTPSLPVTRRDALAALGAGPYPNRGVVLAQRGLGGVGDWTVVDLDRVTIDRFAIGPSGDGTLAVNERNRVGRSLSAEDAEPIIQEASAIRESPPVYPGSTMVAPVDGQCDVALLEGEDVRFGYGGACPPGTERLVRMIRNIGALAPHESQGRQRDSSD